jgi:hypothetical protein
VRENETKDGESVCIQCVNRTRLTFAKAEKDITNVLKANNGTPHHFRIVARSKASAEMRDKIKNHVKSLAVSECDIWSGAEFEEFLRHGAESLLKRFVDGEPFPNAPEDLKKLAESTQPLNDDEILAVFARVFDRPAFYTPIQQESNLGDFKLSGQVERSHRTHHEEFYQVIPDDWNVAQLNPQLRRWEHIYNTVRPHQALRYLTPLEFLERCKSQQEKAECH